MIGRSWAAVLVALSIVLTPALADARAGGAYRAGGGSSFTSRGCRGFNTYQYNGAPPIACSLTPQTAPNAPDGSDRSGLTLAALGESASLLDSSAEG